MSPALAALSCPVPCLRLAGQADMSWRAPVAAQHRCSADEWHWRELQEAERRPAPRCPPLEFEAGERLP